jgi:hypothetical protein
VIAGFPIELYDHAFYVISESNQLIHVDGGFQLNLYAFKTNKRNTLYSDDSSDAIPIFHLQRGSAKVQVDYIPFRDGKAGFSRLRFEATTKSNARVKNMPNPEQQFFRIVATVMAVCGTSKIKVISKVSGPIIVRGQHPGLYNT